MLPRLLLAALLLPAVTRADDLPAKIVGKWELTKTDRLASGGSFTIVFAKDGTAKGLMGTKQMKTVNDYKWAIDEGRLALTTKDEGAYKFEPAAITIGDKKLVLKYKDGTEEEFTRAK